MVVMIMMMMIRLIVDWMGDKAAKDEIKSSSRSLSAAVEQWSTFLDWLNRKITKRKVAKSKNL